MLYQYSEINDVCEKRDYFPNSLFPPQHHDCQSAHADWQFGRYKQWCPKLTATKKFSGNHRRNYTINYAH